MLPDKVSAFRFDYYVAGIKYESLKDRIMLAYFSGEDGETKMYVALGAAGLVALLIAICCMCCFWKFLRLIFCPNRVQRKQKVTDGRPVQGEVFRDEFEFKDRKEYL